MNAQPPANARLIAAAPELLALAERYASECAECDGTGHLRGEHGFEEACPGCYDIRAVLAKAGAS